MCEAAYQKKKQHTHANLSPLHPTPPDQANKHKTPSNNDELNPGFPIKAETDQLYFISPSLISRIVSVDVKHHVYLLISFSNLS